MQVKFKKLHPDGVLPKHQKEGDAGMDLTAVSIEHDDYTGKSTHEYGIAVEIPEGHVGLMFPRSSIHKTNNRMSNAVGVIDSGYRAGIKAVFDTFVGEDPLYKVGDRTAQLVIVPYVKVNPEWADELSQTDRGENGFGSTGK